MTAPITYHRDVPHVGAFTFRKRVFRDQIRIEANAVRILGGPTDDASLQMTARMLATLELLTVAAPEGWAPAEVDPLDPAEVGIIFQVYGVLRAAEDEFRGKPGASGVGAGPGAVQDGGVHISAPLQPAAD